MINNLKELNTYLQRFKPGSISDGDVYTLDRIRQLMPAIGAPQERMSIIHVAGTSGKTSTCYYITSLLKATGAKVGLSISPHIFNLNERFQINGQPIDEPKLCSLFNEFIEIEGVLELKPTYFELIIAFAFWAFYQEGCQYVVVEVGLGGLKDGTNIIQNPDKVAVITDIGLDHTRILGDSLDKIAFQKAGIINFHNQVFCYNQHRDINQAIDNQAAKMHAMVHRFDQTDLELQTGFVKDMPLYQRRNWLLAKQVVDFVIIRDGLQIPSQDKLEKSQKLKIPARLQRINVGNKILILDGAHNPQKLEALIASLKQLYPRKSFSVLASFLTSKQETVLQSLVRLHEITDNVIVTEFTPDADLPHTVIPAKSLSNYCKQVNFTKVKTVADRQAAFDELLKSKSDILLITGSFYLIASLKDKIEEYTK